MGFLSGKRILVTGVASKLSFAVHRLSDTVGDAPRRS